MSKAAVKPAKKSFADFDMDAMDFSAVPANTEFKAAGRFQRLPLRASLRCVVRVFALLKRWALRPRHWTPLKYRRSRMRESQSATQNTNGCGIISRRC